MGTRARRVTEHLRIEAPTRSRNTTDQDQPPAPQRGDDDARPQQDLTALWPATRRLASAMPTNAAQSLPAGTSEARARDQPSVRVAPHTPLGADPYGIGTGRSGTGPVMPPTLSILTAVPSVPAAKKVKAPSLTTVHHAATSDREDVGKALRPGLREGSGVSGAGPPSSKSRTSPTDVSDAAATGLVRALVHKRCAAD